MTSKILAAAGAAAPRIVAPSFLERWAPAAGTVFAALFVAAVVIGARRVRKFDPAANHGLLKQRGSCASSTLPRLGGLR
jgi:hypothetical protein